VSHGCGPNPWGKTVSADNAICSNQSDSHCSSEGHYRIGNRGVSSWGIKVNYLLHGLEKTNNNALKRAIVLHSWEEVSNSKVYPNGVPEGWGCPAVSNEMMMYLDQLIKDEKNILLWIIR
jgi:L,D-transpeptidase catalytic domain